MNRIWISRTASLPVREQISAQLIFAILSGRLSPAERLPSVRDLARRIKVHPNTVSAAYRDLASRGWVRQKRGSGVFVSDIQHANGGDGIEAFMHAWLQQGRERGFSFDELSSAFEKCLEERKAQGKPKRLLVIHPDRNFARILAAEIEDAVHCTVSFANLDDAAQLPEFETFRLLTTASAAGAVSNLHPEGCQVIPLKSMEELLNGLDRPAPPILVGIVSRSETILKWGSKLLPALGLTGSDIIPRNPEEPTWRDGLRACDLIAADIFAARELPGTARRVVLRLIPDSFLEELHQLVKAQKP